MFRAALIAFCLSAAAAGAQAPIAVAVPPVAAAGVIESDGRRSCSGVLIAPDLVATAAHCVGGGKLASEGGDRVIRFHTGAYPGHLSTVREVARIMRHPLYRPDALGARERLSGDLALLRLSEPVPGTVAKPIPLGDPIAPGERLLIASWPGGAGSRARERICPAITTGPQVATLSCIVVSGESGAPVVRLTPEGPRLAAIVVATSRAGHQPFAFTVQAGPRIRQLSAIYLDEEP